MHRIDCHVLTLHDSNPQWLRLMQADLDQAAVNQHWLPGVPGNIGAARAAGFRAGSAEFVTFADPDDRYDPTVFGALASLLDDLPTAPFAFAGEQQIDPRGNAISAPLLHPYDPAGHLDSPCHVHGVIVMRRRLVEPLLTLITSIHIAPEWHLTLKLTNHGMPVSMPRIGRWWRRHGSQATISAPPRPDAFRR
ncbi:hypothetical protein ACFQ4M_15990 [Thauera mechernichensis]|uniref:Glycosyltransferase 2-like domain-containing protein n=1 Tax=Thauera mechernichensis TaxID=82788 RepID=A0ABW3WHC8_9RHOO|nr:MULTISPECIES: hypothetical protein [Thauera]ENO92743.1 hypothetical protein C662_10331 [Thauera sp. 28]MDG3063244.1 hypothetical protein [Thauera mechernichensis]